MTFYDYTITREGNNTKIKKGSKEITVSNTKIDEILYRINDISSLKKQLESFFVSESATDQLKQGNSATVRVGDNEITVSKYDV